MKRGTMPLMKRPGVGASGHITRLSFTVGSASPVRMQRKIRGVGDLVALVANPIKRAIMRHGPHFLRRKLKNCNCDRRRRWLNERLPL